MFKPKKIFALLIFLPVFVLIIIFINKNSKGTIVIETSTPSDIYINNEFKGTTPYEEIREIGEIKISIVPKDLLFQKFEQKVDIFSGVKTIVRRRFGEVQSSGELVYLKKDKSNRASIAVVTNPQGAKVYINEKYIDVSPIKVFDVSEGQYKIKVKSDMFLDQELNIVAKKGYSLNIVFDLAFNLEYQKPNSPILPSFENTNEVEKIVTQSEETDFVRVRKNANLTSEEIFQVGINEEFEVLDYVDGWYQIKIEKDGLETIGWISEKYATIQDSNN